MNPEDIIYTVKDMVKNEFVKKFGNVLPFDELLSDAYYWLSSTGRIEKIIDIADNNPEAVYMTYIRASLHRLFSRKVTDELIHGSYSQYSMDSAGNNDNHETTKSSYMDFENFKSYLDNDRNVAVVIKDETLMDSLTPMQREAFELSYVHRLDRSTAAKKLGISFQTFHDRRNKALRNIFLSLNSLHSSL